MRGSSTPWWGTLPVPTIPTARLASSMYINGPNQKDPWNAEFVKNPNRRAADAEVLIVTSVLQADHSIDCHFRGSFEFLFLDVLTFREELQFTSRLRYMHRTDMAPFRYGWYEPGRPDSRCSTAPPTLASWMTYMRRCSLKITFWCDRSRLCGRVSPVIPTIATWNCTSGSITIAMFPLWRIFA